MPLTFPSHAAVVLPLKLWRPRWFDAVALCAGAVAPDAGYLLRGTPFEPPYTHAPAGLLWWCLPVALGYAWIVRRTIGPVARQLPGRWRAYALVGGHRHRWWVTVGSALVGSVTHVGWDWLTHTDGWLRALLGVDFHADTGWYWWTVADQGSTLVGAVTAVLVAARIARRTDIVGPGEPAPPTRPRTFRTVALVTATAGLAVLPFLPAAESVAATGVRLLHAVAVALLLGAAAVTVAPGSERRSGGAPPDGAARPAVPDQSAPGESGSAAPTPARTWRTR